MEDRTSAPRDYVPEQGTPEYLFPVPGDIGELLSKHTSLTAEIPDNPAHSRPGLAFLIALSIALPAGGAVLFGNQHLPNPFPLDVLLVMLVLLAGVLFGVVFLRLYRDSDFIHFSGYVGTKGAACATCSGKRANLTVNQKFLFEDAADLRQTCSHNYEQEIYQGTTYEFTWTNLDGRPVFHVKGIHGGEHDPPRTSPFHLARIAEDAWSLFLLDKLAAALDRDGSVRFRLSAGNFVVLRKDTLELNVNGKVQQLSADDVSEMQIADGEIAVKEPGAQEGWVTSNGVHRFSFFDLANAMVFVHFMQRLFDIPMTFHRKFKE